MKCDHFDFCVNAKKLDYHTYTALFSFWKDISNILKSLWPVEWELHKNTELTEMARGIMVCLTDNTDWSLKIKFCHMYSFTSATTDPFANFAIFPVENFIVLWWMDLKEISLDEFFYKRRNTEVTMRNSFALFHCATQLTKILTGHQFQIQLHILYFYIFYIFLVHSAMQKNTPCSTLRESLPEPPCWLYNLFPVSSFFS